jgi:clan AA aspartic protease (TIGR02281 family)
MTRYHAFWGLCILLAGSALRADDAPADDALKAKGLRRAGAAYALPAEAEVAKRLGVVRTLLKDLSLGMAQQQGMTAEAENNKKLIVTFTQQRRQLRQQLSMASSTEEHNQIVDTMNELGDRINLLLQGGDDSKGAKERAEKVAQKREAYVQALLDLRNLIDKTDKQYANLADDAEVKEALARANAKTKAPIKLGPTRAYLANVKAFQKLEGMILTETISLQRDGGVFLVDTTLNNKVTKSMIFDTGASSISLPADLASQVGLKPTADTPTVEVHIADGSKVEAKLMTLDTVRVGKFVAENVQCLVMPPKYSNAPALLGGSFLRNFAYKITPETGKLTLSKVATPTAERPAGRQAKKR